MLNRKITVFIFIGIFACCSIFGQDITMVKKFERARKTIHSSISLNLFGFGIGSFVQGDIKGAIVQICFSTVGYALLLPGIFANFETREWVVDVPYRHYPYQDEVGHYETRVNSGAKYALISLGSIFLGANSYIGTIRPVLYQFDKQFDEFYNTRNQSRWPAGEN